MTPTAGRGRAPLNLGGEQAEADPLLRESFYASRDYLALASREDEKCFVIGRTGGGKSAALRQLEDANPEHVVRLNPEDLSLPYITDLGVVRRLAELNVHLDPLFIALWKHVLLVELIRHRYKVNTPEAKTNFMNMLREKIKRDPSKQAALEYLDEFEGKFWCETDERVREITQKFEERLGTEGAVEAGAGPAKLRVGGGGSETSSLEVRAQEAERYQRIVNETQLARLNQMIKVLDEDILDAQHYTYVVIDDLDRDWVDEGVANDLIRCLFRTVVDLKRVRNLKILVALRTNLFEQLRFGHTGGQEEKFRALSLHMRWSPRDLEEMLNARTVAACKRANRKLVTSVKQLLPAGTRKGDALEYIIDRTLLRPRDAISYMNEILTRANGKARATWEDVTTAERAYSSNRLLALRDEWKLTYPDLHKVFHVFSKAPRSMSRDELQERLDEAILLPVDRGFRGVRWMTELSQALWEPGDATWAERYQPLMGVLFNIGFLGIRPPGQGLVYVHDQVGFAETLAACAENNFYAVHPMFHAALDIFAGAD